MKKYINPAHLVDFSPWPVYVSLTLVFMILSSNMLIPFLNLILIISLWFRDILRESHAGHHTKLVQSGLSYGFFIFILSEIMIFFSLFWGFFHNSLSPAVDIGLTFPPVGIEAVSFTSIPLMGSVLLLSSGFFVTLSHHYFLSGEKELSLNYGLVTIILGTFFVILQLTEYYNGTFTITDSVFGNIFYFTTGLHGLHVILGVVFLIIQYIRLYLDHITLEHSVGLDFAIIYYHFVDLVWLFVYFFYYWWIY